MKECFEQPGRDTCYNKQAISIIVWALETFQRLLGAISVIVWALENEGIFRTARARYLLKQTGNLYYCIGTGNIPAPTVWAGPSNREILPFFLIQKTNLK